jgi:predicted MPP superfamily phosphohydrolase
VIHRRRYFDSLAADRAIAAAARDAAPPAKAERSMGGRRLLVQWWKTRDLVWNHTPLPLVDLPEAMDGFRIVHLADLHLRSHAEDAYRQVIERVNANPPDLILFTGDFVEDRYDPSAAIGRVEDFFRALRSKYGVYAIAGNHDPDVMLPYLTASGIQFITHRRIVVDTERGAVELIGFPGPSRSDLDPDFLAALPQPIAGVPRIVLSHYPDLFPAAFGLAPDVYLAGHTHGGQVCLPNGSPLLTHDQMPRRLSKGVHRIGKTWYAVSRGMGFTGISVRLFCAAEVREFTFRRVMAENSKTETAAGRP